MQGWRPDSVIAAKAARSSGLLAVHANVPGRTFVRVTTIVARSRRPRLELLNLHCMNPSAMLCGSPKGTPVGRMPS
jgi:hypothetical protein